MVDAVGFAPAHQRVAAEAGIGTQQDPHPRPAPAELANDPRNLLDRTGSGIEVRPPQLRRQQMPAAEDVERQVAEAVVIAVGEPPFLVAVQRIVGGWQWASRNRSTNRASMAAGSWLIRWYRVASGRARFQPVQGAFPGERGAARAPLPRACRPGWRAPGHGAVGHDRPGPRGQGQCRQPAVAAVSADRARCNQHSAGR